MATPPPLRVLVVGASIAGPMTAYWLARAGAKVTVIERFPAMRTGGQNIDIRTSGVSVMRKIPGMEEAVRAKILHFDGMSLLRSDGRPYGTITSTGNPDQQSLLSEYEIYRGDLAKILYELTVDNENVRYVFDEQIKSLKQDPAAQTPVSVEFSGTLPSSDFDLVVACDGATSRTRALGLECGVRDHIVPVNAWAAFVTMKATIFAQDNIARAHSAVGGRFIAGGTDKDGRTRAAFFGVRPRNQPDALGPFREAMKLGEDALKEYIANEMRGAGWKSDELLEAMMTAEDLYANEVVQVRVPNITRGRFALVGDAGYGPGPTGTGTTLAMTGGYILAGELCKHGNDIAAGLRGYEETMAPILKEMTKIPPGGLSIMAPYTAWGLWLRNSIFAFLTNSGLIFFAQKLFSSAFGSTEQYKLPEYPWVR
jgi:2-polyprenyl-6-methoxyphenol hydroxylase-like FAD-dependent oxidoreductase